MCGIVGYFGSAGNGLTRILTAMSAIIYRAPDSTGVGLFGDDRRPLRIRRAVGSVGELVAALPAQGLWDDTDRSWPERLVPAAARDPAERQWRLLRLEGLPTDAFEALTRSGGDHPRAADLLRDDGRGPGWRLQPGLPGRPGPLPVFELGSPRRLAPLVATLQTDYDLSPVAIHALLRRHLSIVVRRKIESGQVPVAPEAVLAAFDRHFQRFAVRRPAATGTAPRRGGGSLDYRAQRALLQCLRDTVFELPADCDPDGVRAVFRLLDAAVLSRLPGEPAIAEALEAVFDDLWPPSRRPAEAGWRALYGLEKGANLYGWAAAGALAWLKGDMARAGLPAPGASTGRRAWGVPLMHALPPVIAHGRWALQSAVTEANAHPFMDAGRRRAIVLNGQFDGRTEKRLRRYLAEVGGHRFRSENSAEYLALLWGEYFDRMAGEQQRQGQVRREVEAGLDDLGIGSRAIDYRVHRRIAGLARADLDRLAFVEAVTRIVADGGQVAAAGISLDSPRRLYVASHHRPVFVVQRRDRDDFMVVSDINAALGLFSQARIRAAAAALADLDAGRDAPADGADRAGRGDREEARRRLLAPFTVRVHPLDGERLLACIATCDSGGRLLRRLTVTDFDLRPLPEVEPFDAVLSPEPVRKALDRSFHEAHLEEVPDRLADILDAYGPAADRRRSFDLREGRLRRRFGRDWNGLRRVVLVGTGSSYHMGGMVKPFLHALLPDLDVLLERPGERAGLAGTLQPEHDLVLLLSWSSTTADMVQFARQALARDPMMVAVTEKRFGDMALLAERSVGVVVTRSGEEVTVGAVKSSLCMLLVLHLLVLWIARRRAQEVPASALANLSVLPEEIRRLLADPQTTAFTQELAADRGGDQAVVVIGALNTSGIGQEIALKMEENSWSAVGKPLDYRDADPAFLRRQARHALILVDATSRQRIDEAVAVMAALAAAGVAFAAVSTPNRQGDRIRRYSRGRCFMLPRLAPEAQPFLTLVFCYRLAFDYGLAHGRVAGQAPRNRAKSVTVTRSLPRRGPTPAAILAELAHTAAEEAPPAAGRPEESCWEAGAASADEREAYRLLCRLGRRLGAASALEEICRCPPAVVEGLSRRLFDDVLSVGEGVFIPLDRPADAACKNVVGPWQRLLDIPLRVAFQWEDPSHFGEDVLVVSVASRPPQPDILAGHLGRVRGPRLYVGAAAPAAEAAAAGSLGAVYLREDWGTWAGEALYAGLCLLLTAAWRRQAPARAAVVAAHLGWTEPVLRSLLDDAALLHQTRNAIEENRAYRTAFLVGPPNGIGLGWVERFDREGAILLERHAYGTSAHGPLVTVDPRCEAKYVRLAARAEMVRRCGQPQVTRWEAQFLDKHLVDEFLQRPGECMPLQPPMPFFAENGWYLPVMRPDYDPQPDNLILLDATADRYLPQALDELSSFGARYARLVLIVQGALYGASEARDYHRYPIHRTLILPSVATADGGRPISEMLLPFAMGLLAARMAAVSRAVVAAAAENPE